ncbi:hypothetical protein NA57DRAFT_70598 [Rhizodiscina lignyota]|uniref:Uncharacterized protein n=1 Tax=Rhizodiscina lignyota TaxID=1504668 RepID=A0A9P4IMR6_9PEZI|nr:hypothetical protein NA57DRAFT_70598 [Rhizodiscina lignyota]
MIRSHVERLARQTTLRYHDEIRRDVIKIRTESLIETFREEFASGKYPIAMWTAAVKIIEDDVQVLRASRKYMRVKRYMEKTFPVFQSPESLAKLNCAEYKVQWALHIREIREPMMVCDDYVESLGVSVLQSLGNTPLHVASVLGRLIVKRDLMLKDPSEDRPSDDIRAKLTASPC